MFGRIILWLLASRLSILQKRQTAHKLNDAKTLQLQPFVLTQSINDLLTLNDSFATEEAKRKNRNQLHKRTPGGWLRVCSTCKCSFMFFFIIEIVLPLFLFGNFLIFIGCVSQHSWQQKKNVYIDTNIYNIHLCSYFFLFAVIAIRAIITFGFFLSSLFLVLFGSVRFLNCECSTLNYDLGIALCSMYSWQAE